MVIMSANYSRRRIQNKHGYAGSRYIELGKWLHLKMVAITCNYSFVTHSLRERDVLMSI